MIIRAISIESNDLAVIIRAMNIEPNSLAVIIRAIKLSQCSSCGN